MNTEYNQEEHSKEYYVGLDIGTSKVAAIIVSVNEKNKYSILGLGSRPCEGLREGIVRNISKTKEAIIGAIKDAQDASGLAVRSVCVGIAGDHIGFLTSRFEITKSDNNVVSKYDVERIIENSKKMQMDEGREIIHAIPEYFILDRKENDKVVDPIGLFGQHIDSFVKIITGKKSDIKNIVRSVGECGYEVANITLEPIAASYAVLHEEERKAGVILIDIGSGTTDVAVFINNTLVYTGIIPIGGSHVTADIGIGLSVSDPIAEKLKLEKGSCYMTKEDETKIITIPGITNDRPERNAYQWYLTKIVQARMMEIFEVVKQHFVTSGHNREDMRAGIVLTGGGALTKNIKSLCGEMFNMEVRVGTPLNLNKGLLEKVETPIYATLVGLAQYAMENSKPHRRSRKNANVGGIMERIKRWFTEL